MDTGNGVRPRHAARDVETSGEVWWVTGVGDVQLDGVSRREKRGGAGSTERDATMKNG